jgi:hypothetical protein
MRRLVAIAIILSVGGAGCGGCVDDDTTQGQTQHSGDGTRIRRQRIAATIIAELDAGPPPGSAAGDR